MVSRYELASANKHIKLLLTFPKEIVSYIQDVLSSKSHIIEYLSFMKGYKRHFGDVFHLKIAPYCGKLK